MIARFDPASYWQASPGALTSWGWQEGGYWLRLKSPADAAAIEAQLPAWEKRNIPDENDGVRISNPGEFQDWKRSEEHTSELQSLMRISYAVFCLKKKRNNHNCNHNAA